MFRSGMRVLGSAALALALLVFAAAPASAQKVHSGGWHGEGWNGGFDPDFSWRGNWPEGSYNSYTGYPEYYGNTYTQPYSPNTAFYYSPSFNSSDTGLGQFNYPQGMSAYYTPSNSLNNSRSVLVNLHVPANSQVWFDGNPTQQSGEWRSYISPPLDSDKTMHYDVRVKWMDQNGKAMDQTRRIPVRAGQRANVDFFRQDNSNNAATNDNNQKRDNLNQDNATRDNNLNRDLNNPKTTDTTPKSPTNAAPKTGNNNNPTNPKP